MKTVSQKTLLQKAGSKCDNASSGRKRHHEGGAENVICPSCGLPQRPTLENYSEREMTFNVHYCVCDQVTED